jgi:hypothetical protein
MPHLVTKTPMQFRIELMGDVLTDEGQVVNWEDHKEDLPTFIG